MTCIYTRHDELYAILVYVMVYVHAVNIITFECLSLYNDDK